MKPGTFIRSTALLNDSIFEDTVIYIAEYNTKGALGFVVSKLSSRRFNELKEFITSPPIRLHDGGPVDKEHIYFVHQRPDLISGGTLIADNTYLGGNFKMAVKLMNNKTITEKDIRLFIGYCGWDDGELDSEVEEGSWEVVKERELFLTDSKSMAIDILVSFASIRIASNQQRKRPSLLN